MTLNMEEITVIVKKVKVKFPQTLNSNFFYCYIHTWTFTVFTPFQNICLRCICPLQRCRDYLFKAWFKCRILPVPNQILILDDWKEYVQLI